MGKRSAFIAILAASWLMAAPLRAQQKDASSGETESAAAQNAANQSSKAATQDPNYVIGAQDVLDINVWKEPSVSRTVPVRSDGKISLPLLDDVQAAGLTPMQLTASLTEKLKKFLEDPQVTVIVTQINSQRVYIIGQVMRPGAFPLLPNMTILQALATAGGLAQFANGKKIYLLRTEGGKQVRYNFNYKDVLSGRKPEENLVLKTGDQIVVP
ncbi:MAG TPA: polysaccharide biosynthesis/export family protein [Verrucomicrobiae bacterium]|nr:polysaccharide biosynthesis/export family protein [Verrucomicrobiae bacterium]